MSSTPAVFPTSIVTFTTKVNHIDVVNDDDCNKLQNEVIALQTYIGTSPQGSRADLTTRIGIMMATDGAIAKGSSFPTNPVEGQEFWRTDLKTLYVYNATASQWASQGQSLSNNIFSFSGTGDPNGTASVNGFILSPTMISTAVPSNAYWTVKGATFATCILTSFYKISGISTAVIKARIWQAQALGDSAEVRVDIGSLFGTSRGTASRTAPELVTSTIDISSLASGTYYDVVISLRTTTAGDTGYLNSIIGIGQ